MPAGVSEKQSVPNVTDRGPCIEDVGDGFPDPENVGAQFIRRNAGSGVPGSTPSAVWSQECENS
jgi:hypothetical protein